MALKSHFGFISEGSHRLSWKLNGNLQSVLLEDKVTCTAYSETHDLVLVLTSSDGSSVGDKLIGYRGSGQLLFEVNEPLDYSFYYLSSHIHHETAVVCISKCHRYDWFYAINPETGQLESLNRAY
ncbi:TPA: hypothetical protein ACGUPG_004540 [Vibrio vulnificus]|uniref:hypothetical protein n=1 Tax=Vibrio TaxID=662 RepID=UPI00102ADE98|nr:MULTISPECIES: hypothetical protein [Vibrio]ELV8623127.1 hypothetical protein [Vibrio vulnificus]ELV8738040.1 hypothetical protein [Vibrio vulnificus]MCC2524656.1 hypothetical protein [Vibrio coralliilyticus]MCU8300188.1 hypothetical protein [Vibrio vulnificus]HAS6078519.1 hypothetical protein [Vibrio vulnificus]